MKKEKVLSIRIDKNTYSKLEMKAESLGISLSSAAELILRNGSEKCSQTDYAQNCYIREKINEFYIVLQRGEEITERHLDQLTKEVDKLWIRS